jgi:hypothetical protein
MSEAMSLRRLELTPLDHVERPTSDVRRPTSEVTEARLRTSDFRLRTFDLGPVLARLSSERAAPWLWLAPGAAGLAVTALIMLILPPDRTLHGFGDFFLKICPLVFAVLTIALFPRKGAVSLGLAVLGFVFYLGYVDSAYVIQVSHLVDGAVAGRGAEQFNAFYRFAVFVNAFTVLFAVFAYRMGGAGAASVLKLGGAGVLLLISGLNDLTMWAMYPWPDGQRPEVFSWASHVSIFLGQAPRLTDMLLFLAIHVLLAVALLALPLQRWIDRSIDRTFAER